MRKIHGTFLSFKNFILEKDCVVNWVRSSQLTTKLEQRMRRMYNNCVYMHVIFYMLSSVCIDLKTV